MLRSAASALTMVVVFVRYAEGDVAVVEDWCGFGREVEAEKRSLLDLLTFVSKQA